VRGQRVRWSVAAQVEAQVVGAREGAAAERACEGPVAGVLARVARQLVRAREAPRAPRPPAPVRLLACTTTYMGYTRKTSISEPWSTDTMLSVYLFSEAYQIHCNYAVYVYLLVSYR
jgi:hypothetical protein